MKLRFEDDRLFRDFIEDISVTSEELAAIVRMPEMSILEVKQYLRNLESVRATRADIQSSALTG